MSTTKRITKRLIAVILTVLMLMSMVTIGMTSASAAYVDIAQTGASVPDKLYLVPNSNWTKDGARFAAYFFGNGENWASMTKVAGESNLYEVAVPAGYPSVIFCRMNPSATANNWNNKWNQSGDLTIPTNGNNKFTVANGSWDGATTSWSKYTPPATVPAAPTNVAVTVTDVQGSGTVEAPYIVEAESKVTLNISGDKGGATGIGYSLNGDTKTKATTVEVDAPVAGETITYTVDVYTYNVGSDTKWSATSVPVPVSIRAEAEIEEVFYGTEFAIDWAVVDGLYAYAGDATAITEEAQPDTEAWQRWLEKTTGNRVFYLPASANAEKVAIFNAYDHTVQVGDTPISAGYYEIVDYVEGTTYTTIGADDQTLTIYNTDAEASLFINTDKEKGSVVDDVKTVVEGEFEEDGVTPLKEKKETKLSDLTGQIWYEYLVAGSTKNREGKKLGGAVAVDDGVVVNQVKKIKGRGNTTWNETKKPFNITFADPIAIDGMDEYTKWSLLANAKDDSLMRNRLVYDIANEVNMKYACDSRFVDFFVDGRYMGSYLLTQKIEMEPGSVMGDLNEPIVEVDKEGDVVPTENFDFVLELDTAANAANAGDETFETDCKQVMTYKIPEEPTDEQVAFIKAKYQAVEDALYGTETEEPSLEKLAELVDINDFARAYLINELAKNIDSGVTSCYFVYNSDEGKFFTSPVWDYDNAVGNMKESVERLDSNDKILSLINTNGWYAKELMHFDSSFEGDRSVFSQACYMTSTTADGKTFADIVAEIWATDFADIDDILAGDATAEKGRLKSIAGYKALLAKSGQWNYEKSWKADNGWTLNHDWTADHSVLNMYDYDAESNTYTVAKTNYDEDKAADMNQFVGDWLISRINWIDAQYNDAKLAEVPVAPEGYVTVYFQNNWMWSDVKVYAYIGSSPAAGYTWPGKAMTLFENDGDYDIYYAIVPDGTNVIFTGIKDDGSGALDQSPDNVAAVDGRCYYMKWENDSNKVGYENIETMLPDALPEAPIVIKKVPVFLDATEWVVEGETATYTVQYLVGDDAIAPAAEGDNIVEMTLVEGETSLYTAEIPENTTHVVFTKNVVGDGASVATTGPIDINPDSNTYVITGTTTDETTGEVIVTGEWYVEEPFTSKTTYVINSAKWDKLVAHTWTEGGAGTTWPGTEMTKTEDKVNGFDVYSITVNVDYESIIFNNNNNGKQTDNLTFMADQYYDLKTGTWYASLDDVPAIDPLSTDRYILGDFNEWNTLSHEFKLNAEGEKVGYISIDLKANTTYEFKVIREGAWTSYKGTITGNAEGLQFSSSVSDNAKLTTTVAGKYVFAFGLNDSKLSVTYPETKTVYFDPATFGGVTADTVITANGTKMTRLDDGKYTAVVADDYDITFGWQITDEEGVPALYTVFAGKDAENNLYTLTGEAEGNFTGEWGVYVAPVEPEMETIYLDLNNVLTIVDGETLKVNGVDMAYDGTYYYAEIEVADAIIFEHVISDDNSTAYTAAERDAEGQNLYTFTEINPDENGNPVATGTWSVYGEEPPFEPYTVYFINGGNWAEVYVYAWNEGADGFTWPGEAMTKVEDVTVNGFDVYSYTFEDEYASVIFNNNNNGIQSDDLEMVKGQYYDLRSKAWYASISEVPPVDPLSTDRFIVGDWDEWNATAYEFRLNAEGEEYGYVTLDLEANTTYEFKVLRQGAWASNTTAITGTVEGLTFSSSNKDNAKITTTVAGTYVFSFGLNDSKLSVEYPATQTIYLDVADFWTVGENNAPTVDDTVMTLVKDTTYKAEIPADATDITFALATTVTGEDDSTSTSIIKIDTTIEAGCDIFTLTSAEDGFWAVYSEEGLLPTVVTVYLVNSNNWEAVNAYAWEGEEIPVAFPGTAMDITEEKVDGYDVYALSFNSKYTNIAFNDGTDTNKTDDLKVADGKYYDLMTKAWYENAEDITYDIVLLINGAEYTFTPNEDGYSYIELELAASETPYEFQISRMGTVVNAKTDETITSTDFTATTNNITFSRSATEKATIAVTEETAGTFTFVYYDSKLAINYPGSEEIVKPDMPVVDTTVKLAGDFTDPAWGEGAIEFTLVEGSETVYTLEKYFAAGTYEFKLIEFGTWLGNKGQINNEMTEETGWTFKNSVNDNCTLITTGGTYTFTFDSETDKLLITAVLDEIPPVEYNVTLLNEGNFTFDGAETATEGEDYAFTVTPAEGYVIAAVIYDMTALEAVDGVYTIEDVDGDINLYIVTAEESRVEEKPPTSVFTVTFLKKDGSIDNIRKTYLGEEVAIYTAPYIEGYVFEGWDPAPVISKEENGVQYMIVDKDYVFKPIYTEDTNDLPVITPPTEPTTPVVPEVKTWTVIFVDEDNNYIGYTKVEDGKAATAPEAPAKAGYEFIGWKGDFSAVTEDLIIVADYEKKASDTPVTPVTTGKLQIEVAGGTGFTINGRPQGTSYYNTKMDIGTAVTVVASTTNGNTFIGWVNVANNQIVSTSETYTFNTTGNDFVKAMYQTDVTGANLVVFKNDKSNQIREMQYYAYGDTIVFPNNPSQVGWDFTGWDHTEAQIQTKLQAGQDVTVLAKWTLAPMYVDITVVNGTAPNGNGEYGYNVQLTITADAAPDGQKFAYWVDQDGNVRSYVSKYTFFPMTDMTLTAVYVDEDATIDYNVLVYIDNIDTITTDGKNVFSYSWNVPVTQTAGTENALTYVGSGVLAIDEDYYYDGALVVGTTAPNSYQRTPDSAHSTAVNSFSWTKSNVAVGDTWVARAYVQYKIAGDNTVHTAYSDIVTATK